MAAAPPFDLRTLVEFADIGVWSCDLPFAELKWNPAVKAHFGLPPDATVTIDTFYERMHPDDVATTRAAIDESVRGGRPYDVDYRTLQPDGSYRWIRALGRTEYDAQGVALRFEGITIDISATRRAHEQLRELADAMPQIVWSADASGRVDYLNRRWYEVTGKPAGSIDFDGIVHDEDGRALSETFGHAVDSGQPWEHEFRLCLPGHAEPRWFLGRARPVRDQAGRIVRWYATSTDIHDTKQTAAALTDSRDRLRAALDASATGTFRWNIESNTLDWDENLDRLFGLAPGSTAQSLTEFLRLVHPDDRQRVIDACGRCAAHNVDFVEEFRVVWPDGTVRWLFDQGRVLTAAGGGRYMIGACVDVTERRLKEEALRAADRQKDEFLGMLAHEIRNPLAPVIYAAAILQRTIQDPALRRPLDIIQRQAARMTRIVDDLLDISRVTQGKILLRHERVVIEALLSQSIEATRPAMESRGHTVVLHPVNASLAVPGDPVRLAQVIENLLNNAAKYSPDGGRIEVSAQPAGGTVVIAVKDTGVGIAPAMLERVFDLFAQADTSLDRAEGGLGIGLTLVDRLTQMHGGQARAFSAGLGQGSTFTVTLPVLAEAEPREAPVAALAGASGLRRVLVVDDNHDAAETLRQLIAMGGHDVRVAHDGADAVAAAATFTPDLVLLDIGLPSRDGYHVIKDLRALPALHGAKVIATTGYGREEDRLRCLQAGFDGHATKPIGVDELLGILNASR